MTFRVNLAAATVGAAVLAFAGMAQASTTAIGGLYNTGTGADYASAASTGVEQHWTLNTGTAYVGGQNGVFPLNGPWLAEDATSRWIGPTVTAGGDADPINSGYYEYTLSFNLSSAEAAGASFLGRFAADNAVSWIKLNDTVLATGPVGGFSSWTAFNAATPAFQAGQNDLKFRVVNYGQTTGNPTGLRVEFAGATIGAAAVPEPGAWALMIMGFGGAGVMLRAGRRRTVAA